MKYLICFDLDGCILNDDKNISEHLIEVVNKLRARGHIIIFNTARNYNRVLKYASILQPAYINCLCGSCVINKDGVIIYKKEMSQELVKSVFDVMDKYNLEFACSERIREEFCASKEYAIKHNKTYKSLEDIKNNYSYKLIFLYKETLNPEMIKELELLNINVAISHKNKYVRITDSDKYDGIKVILSDLSLNNIKVMAFGDDLTDYKTLSCVDVGVALLNSNNELLKHIKNVTKFTNNENGVSRFLQDYFQL